MSVLVTGHKGFIGKKLVESLKNLKLDVVGIDADYFDNEIWQSHLTRLLCDVNPKTIFHVGACSNTLETNVNLMFERNYESTRIITDWAAENSTKLIYASSAANYGTNKSTPANLYGWSKYTSENYVVLNGGIALRFFNVYGPGEEHKSEMASFIYQSYIRKSLNQEVFLFPNNPKRDFVYIVDVVKALIYAYANYSYLEKTYYEVGTGVAKTFEHLLDSFEIQYKYLSSDKIPQGYQFYTCSEKSKWMKGWQPTYNIDSGIQAYKLYLDSQR